MARIEGIEIEKGRQSTIRMAVAGTTVVIDPYKECGKKADIILITHDHFDHCDPGSVAALSKEGTVAIGPESCTQKIRGIRTMKPGDSAEEKGVGIEAVDAYNVNHKKGDCLGFIISIAGRRVYHAGDTGRIPEMKQLENIDIALLPVGGMYTMNAEEAAAAANEDIRPKVAVPMHYGDVVGSRADAERFRELCECKVVIL